MPFVTDEIVTAAKLNMATSISAANNSDDRTFTNTGFLDLDALTGGAGTMAAVAVTVTTGTLVTVQFGCTMSNSAGITLLGFRVSGATTIAAASAASVRVQQTTAQLYTVSIALPVTVTAGSNAFELQASVTAGTGRVLSPSLVVHTRI